MIIALVVVGAQPAEAIANGSDARDGAYPFSVLLTMTDLPTPDHGTRDSSCSGALIAPRWVITAGHCFRDEDGRRVSRTVARLTTATVGRAKVKGRGGYVEEVVAVHQSETTDVALAELRHAVTRITPLRVGTSPPRAGEVLRLTGFGLTAGQAPASRMQTGRFTVDRVGDSLLETSGRAPSADTSPCPHDSGGPYFREQPDGVAVLVAVVSSGPGCPHTGPDFSARTDNISAWIAGTIDGRPSPYRLAGIAVLVVLGLVVLGWAGRRGYRAAHVPAGRRRAPV